VSKTRRRRLAHRGVSWTLNGEEAALMHGAHKDTPHICVDISRSERSILGRMER
jgi:hypothetical protein